MTKWNKYEMNINKKVKKKEVKPGKVINFLNRKDREVSIILFLIAIWASGYMGGKGWAFYSLLTLVVGFIFTLILVQLEGSNGPNKKRR